MKLVIDLPEETYKRIKDGYVPLGISKYLKNGTPYEERPHGEWVLDKEISYIFNIYECSKCRVNGSRKWRFCPNCGALMKEEGGAK